eukprot:835503_1
MDELNLEILAKLRPAFSRLSNPAHAFETSDVDAARRVLESFECADFKSDKKVHLLQQFSDYILWPLRASVSSRLVAKWPERTQLSVMHALYAALARVFVDDARRWKDMFVALMQFGFVTRALGKGCKADASHSPTFVRSEEIRLFTLKCISSLLNGVHRCSLIAKEIRSESFRLPLGHAVSVILDCALLEKNRKLQLGALDCLEGLLRVIPLESMASFGAPEACSLDSRTRAADVMACFLPGIVSALFRVVSGDFKQGSKVLSAALRCLTNSLISVLGDEVNPSCCAEQAMTVDDLYKMAGNSSQISSNGISGEPKKENNSASNVHPPPVSNRKVPHVDRTATWLTGVCEHVNPRLVRLFSLNFDMKMPWALRREFAISAHRLLVHCPTTLSRALTPLFECLMTLAEDDHPEVRTQAERALESTLRSGRARASFADCVEDLADSCAKLIQRLPQLMRSGSDHEKLMGLRKICGYIRLVGRSSAPILASMFRDTSQSLSSALLCALELDRHDLFVLEKAERRHDASCRSVPAIQENSAPYFELRFAHCSTDDTRRALLNIPRFFGKFVGESAASTVLAAFLPILRAPPPLTAATDYQAEAAVFVTEFVRGMGARDDGETTTSAVSMLLDEFLDSPLWNIPTHSRVSALTLEEITANALVSACLLRGVGACASVMGSRFDSLLVSALYPVVEKAASAHSLVQQAATATLSLMWLHCGYSSQSEMILRNADYLIDRISLSLRYTQGEADMAPRALQVLLSDSRTAANLLPLLHDTVDQLLRALDIHAAAERTADVFLRALGGVSAAIRVCEERTRREEEEGRQPAEFDVGKDFSPESVRASISDFISAIDEQISSEWDENAPPPPVTDDSPLDERKFEEEKKETEEEEKDPGSELQRLADRILRKSAHFLTSPSISRRFLVLTILNDSVASLASCDRLLCPAVATVWERLRARFRDSDRSVCVAALGVLHTMATHCARFIRRRFRADVWPALRANMARARGADLARLSRTGYRTDWNFKLQRTLLGCLGEMMKQPDMISGHIGEIATECISYLHHAQPAELQQEALRLFERLIRFDADRVWWVVYSHSSVEVLDECVQSANNILPKPLALRSKELEQYSNNCRILMRIIGDKDSRET